jgi:putative glutathione S-transferase
MAEHLLVDGEWRTDVGGRTGDDGVYVSAETTFRDRIEATPDADFPAEPGRYHLYISRACPWAHRAVLIRSFLGLDDAITMDVVDPYRADDGWQFSPEREGCTRDSVSGKDYLREVYLEADPNYTGKVTVPVLWDRESATIVNNESREILRMLDVAFADHAERDLTLYPEGDREAIDRIIDTVHESINSGVYRAGFSEQQSVYEAAVSTLFEALDHWDEVLSTQRYLAGERLTEADICMFTTLVRFDQVYHTHFKCNRRRIAEYDHLHGYLRELYQLPGVAETVNMDHIKEHYYTTHPSINPTGLIAVGPESRLDEPHDRDELPGGPPDALLER